MSSTDDATGNPLRAFLKTLERGEVRNGVVSSVVGFGAFIDIGGGVDGLVNAAELSWLRYDHPTEVVKTGHEVTVVVLDVDLDRERVSLSLKALQPDPFKGFAHTHLGRVLPGRVTKRVPFGVFVRVQDGIEGLIHSSQLIEQAIGTPRNELQVGDEVVVEITGINLSLRRVSLALRR